MQCSCHYLPWTPLNNWIRDNRTFLPRRQMLWIVCTGKNSFDKARDLLWCSHCRALGRAAEAEQCLHRQGASESSQTVTALPMEHFCWYCHKTVMPGKKSKYSQIAAQTHSSSYKLQPFKLLAMIIKVKKLSTLRIHSNYERHFEKWLHNLHRNPSFNLCSQYLLELKTGRLHAIAF